MGSLKEKAKALLQQCEVVTLTSINKEGYPRPVPLSKIKTEGLTTNLVCNRKQFGKDKGISALIRKPAYVSTKRETAWP